MDLTWLPETAAEHFKVDGRTIFVPFRSPPVSTSPPTYRYTVPFPTDEEAAACRCTVTFPTDKEADAAAFGHAVSSAP